MAAIDTGIGRLLGGVAMPVRLLSRARGVSGILRRLFVRRGTFAFRRLLAGRGSFNNGRLLLREGTGQILAKDNTEVFNLLKLADLQSTPAGSSHSRPERLGRSRRTTRGELTSWGALPV